MRVPTTPTDGLFLKFFVLKIDGSDPEALEAAELYASLKEERFGNKALIKDLRRHIKSLGFKTRT